MLPANVQSRLASEFHITAEAVASFEEKVAAGDPIPYLARRYPDLFPGLGIHALRRLRSRIDDARELEQRRANLLKSLDSLGEAGEALRGLVKSAHDAHQLDDVAAHLRKHKGTRGAEAVAKGLEPLSDALAIGKNDGKSPDDLAAGFVNAEKGITTAQEALHGASAILTERFVGEPEIRARVRRELRDRGEIVAKVFDATKPGAERYKDLFDHRERGKSMAPRRYLRLRRAEREKILKLSVEVNVDQLVSELEKSHVGEAPENATDADRAILELRRAALREAISRHLLGALEVDVRSDWKERGDLESISFLRRNLRSMLHRPPLGRVRVMGVEPGVRKGIRVAIADEAGSYLCDATLPNDGEERAAGLEQARTLLREHKVAGIALSAGEAGSAAAAFFLEALQGWTPEAENPTPLPEIFRVPDVGTAAVANSPEAREEFGDKAVPVRAAMSMARRLQDPLAELVKVDAKTLAGGHHGLDVARGRLDRMLADEVEACVYEVPVDLNQAPAPLLALVGAMGTENAKKIVEFRKQNGAFPTRLSLARVGLDERAYDRSVAFLRVVGGETPLDETGVHPAHEAVASKIVAAAGVTTVRELTPENMGALKPEELADEQAPLPLVRLVGELLLDRGTDPRGHVLPTPVNPGVRTMGDLKQAQELEGIVRGMAPFGVFVDIGIAHEGLIHISELCDDYVEDAAQLVHVGQRVRVRVLEVDPAKRKIALTMRSEESRKRAQEERERLRQERLASRERRKQRIAARKASEAAQAAGAPAGAPEGAAAPAEGGERRGNFRRGRGERFREGAGDARRGPSVVARAATTRRDGLGGPGGGGGGRGDRNRGDRRGGPRRDGRGREDFHEENSDAPRPTEPKPQTPPPPNAFKKFFQQRGMIEGS